MAVYSAAVTINIQNTSISLSQDQIKSIDYGTTTRDDNCSLHFGVVEQNVALKFYDKDRSFYRLFSNGGTLEGTIIVFENNGSSNSYEISDVEVDETATQVTLRGIDATKMLDNIIIPKSAIATRTIHQLLTIFFNYLPDNYRWEYLDAETESVAFGIVIPNSWYREGTLRQFLDKVCTVGFLNIFHMQNVFYVMRGVA